LPYTIIFFTNLFFNKDRVKLNEEKELNELIRTSILCNNARFEIKEGIKKKGYEIIGDSTESALVANALDLGINKKLLCDEEKRIKELERKSREENFWDDSRGAGKVMQEIEVEALPKDLPHEIRVDVSQLAILESRIKIKDLLIPQGVKAVGEPDKVLILVESPRAEEELEALKKTPVVEAVAEVKTEQEVKREAKEKDKGEAADEKSIGKEAATKV